MAPSHIADRQGYVQELCPPAAIIPGKPYFPNVPEGYRPPDTTPTGVFSERADWDDRHSKWVDRWAAPPNNADSNYAEYLGALKAKRAEIEEDDRPHNSQRQAGNNNGNVPRRKLRSGATLDGSNHLDEQIPVQDRVILSNEQRTAVQHEMIRKEACFGRTAQLTKLVTQESSIRESLLMIPPAAVQIPAVAAQIPNVAVQRLPVSTQLDSLQVEIPGNNKRKADDAGLGEAHEAGSDEEQYADAVENVLDDNNVNEQPPPGPDGLRVLVNGVAVWIKDPSNAAELAGVKRKIDTAKTQMHISKQARTPTKALLIRLENMGVTLAPDDAQSASPGQGCSTGKGLPARKTVKAK